MIEALLDIMKRSFRILHLSDYVTTSTIAAIIVLVHGPVFHCAGAHRAITAELGVNSLLRAPFRHGCDCSVRREQLAQR